VRFFRRLVRVLFPEDFRVDYESEMTRTFGAQHRETRGGGAKVRLWSETLAGFARTAPREHLAQLRQDVAYALRMMRRSPGFTVIAILTLSTAIGANTAVFSVVNAVLLRPLPYTNGDSVVAVRNLLDGVRDFGFSTPELLDARDRLRSLEAGGFSKVTMNLTGRGDPERLLGTDVTANLFNILGVRPVLGRSFRAEEELPGNGDVVILTHDLWTRLFNSSPDAVGRSLTLDGRPYTVVGVLPRSFVSPDEFGSLERSAFIVPLTMDPAAPRNERGSHYLSTVARPRQGYSFGEAQAELGALIQAFIRENPGEYNAPYRASLVPLRTEIVGEVTRPLAIMLGAVSLVLLIACANVANLLLARGQLRAREIAVRKALGASHGRLVRQVLTESGVLAGIAAVAGVVLARSILTLIIGSVPAIPRLSEVALNAPALAFTGGISIVTALIFGSVPAMHLASKDATSELHAGRTGRSAVRQGVRAVLVTAQVALALVLLVGAALLIQSFTRLLKVPSGFNPERVLTLRLSVPMAGYEERDRVVRFFEQVLDGIRTSTGVVSAGAVAGLPLQSPRGDWDFYMEGETPGPHGSDRPGDWQVVTPGYFEAMGIRLVRGRYLARTDRADSPAVALINETLARMYFPDRDPVGRRIRMSGPDNSWMSIIGVVGDVRQDRLDAPPAAEIYIPHSQFKPFWRDSTMRTLTIVVRTEGDPALATDVVRRQVRAIDPNLPISTVITMDEVFSRSVAEPRVHMFLLGFFAAVALVLAMVGTYSVLAYHTTERTREFGVRMALGAHRREIVRMVIRQGMTPAIGGVLIGVVGAAAITRVLSTLLFETEPLDVATFAATASILLGVALAACCVPARRATRVDPSIALRAE
jgi:predicted permease